MTNYKRSGQSGAKSHDMGEVGNPPTEKFLRFTLALVINANERAVDRLRVFGQ